MRGEAEDGSVHSTDRHRNALGVTQTGAIEHQDELIAYLQGGGNLIATGQNLAVASDINRNPPDDPRYYRSDLYQVYLGAGFVQDDVFTHTATLVVRGGRQSVSLPQRRRWSG